MQPAADKASITCSHLAIYLATYLSSPSSHPCINLYPSLSLSPCPHLCIYVAMRNLSVHPSAHVTQPDKASMTCRRLAIYLSTYLSRLPSGHPCINLTSLTHSLPPSLPHSLTHSFTHTHSSLTHSPTHPLTHSLTHSFTHTHSLSLSLSLSFSMPPSLHLRSYAKLAANMYHVVLGALFGNLSLDLFMHPSSKLW